MEKLREPQAGVTIQYNILGRTAVLSCGVICFVRVLPFESVDKILWCNHLNATSYGVASTFTWYYLFCMYMYMYNHIRVVLSNASPQVLLCGDICFSAFYI